MVMEYRKEIRLGESSQEIRIRGTAEEVIAVLAFIAETEAEIEEEDGEEEEGPIIITDEFMRKLTEEYEG